MLIFSDKLSSFKMNFQLVIIFCFILSDVVFSKNVKIVGGIDTNIREFPYTASLRFVKKQRFLCAGVIISKRHVLSAAHCFDRLNASQIGVFVGTTSSIDYSVPHHTICYLDVHPKYKNVKKMERKSKYDIAIAEVQPAIAFNEFKKKVELPTVDAMPGDIGVITGWGRKAFPKGELSNVLQKADMTIVTNAECEKYIPFSIYNTHICAFQKKGVGACHGDSGAPLVVGGRLIGISCFVRPCATGEPDVYTRIFSFMEFIRSGLQVLHESSCTIL